MADDTATDPRLDIVRENLRVLCAKRKVTYASVSRDADMSRNGLQQFLNGDTSIKYENLLRICDVLQVPVGILHKRDAITDNRMRLYRLLDRLPDHLVAQALAEAQDLARPD